MNIMKSLLARASECSASLFLVICFLLSLVSCDKSNSVDNNNTGTMTDIEGNVYKTIKIGNQVWTVKNLRTTNYK